MKKVIILVVSLSFSVFGQYNGSKFGISASYSYTTSSRLYYFPNAEDPFLRSQSVPFEDIYSYSVELRYRISEAIIAGLNLDYIDQSGYIKPVTALGENGIETLNASDGFMMIPVELSLYYYLPFSAEKFKFYMGGGAGYYIGNHTRKLGSLEVNNVERKTAYGIHVLVGMDYMVLNFLSIRGEMKFRDPEFEVTNEYARNEITYRGREYTISGKEYDAKVNVDGIIFTIGAVYHFSFPGM